ncbi:MULTISPECIES: DUF222 domain-containing protein [unclassified Modestobacter]
MNTLADAAEQGSPAPPVMLSAGPLGAVQAADREIARQTALRARAVAEFAASRPASADRAQGEPGAMSPERWAARAEVLRPVSEWATRELVVALSITAEAAEGLLERSLTLVHRLPRTLAALESGALHSGHLWPMLDKVAPIEDDEVRAEVEVALLAWAAGRVTTPAQLGAKARREVLRRDARAAARQLTRALARRGVHLRPGRTDGTAEVVALLTAPEAQVLLRALGAYADALDEPGDQRTRGQKMADCLLDLVLRPGERELPPVQLMLHLVAPVATVLGGDAPGEVDGQVVPAEMVRALVQAFGGVSGFAADLEADADTDAEADAAAESAAEADGEVEATAEATAEADGEVAGAADGALPSDAPDGREEPVGTTRWWAELEQWLLADDVGPPDLPGGFRDLANAPADGWWATADRAVERAGAELRAAGEALGSARRAVADACRADAVDERSWRTGSIDAADDALAALDAAAAEQRAVLTELLTRTGGGGLADRPRLVLADALSGTFLALTGLPELRRAAHCGARRCRRRPEECTHDLTGRPGLRPPPATDGYRPGAELDRFVRARDRRCRFPGCRRRVPRGGELDHDVPYPAGPTSATNLAGYCTTDHRGKHQAPGWRHELAADGALTVTTPTGLTAVTTPPPY